MTKRLLKVTLYNPSPSGDVPASGYVEARPTLRRHIEGGTPDDFIVTKARGSSHLGAALTYTDEANVEQTAPATPGVAWFWLDVTDEAPYANLWAWTFIERAATGVRRTIQIPTGSGIYDYGDADDLDPDDFTPATPTTPGWTAALQAETARAEAAESALSTGLGLETTARQNADTIEATTRADADTALDGRVTPIETALAGRLSDATLGAKYLRRLETASYTYNSDGTVATETAGGLVTTYTYNADGTVHTANRDGVTLTYSYNADGTVSGVA